MRRIQLSSIKDFISSIPGLRWEWYAAIAIAFLYALVINAPEMVRAAQAGSQPFLQALIQTAGTFGFAVIALGAALDFIVGLVESFRAGMEHDRD